MLILNPAFLEQIPPRKVIAAVLLALVWASLPLLTTLPAGIIAVFGGMLLLRFVLLYLRAGKLPTWFLMILLVAAGAVVWQQLGTVIGREGGISFLLLMIMLKAFEGRVMRDWQVLLLSMLFLVGSAVLFNQSLLTGAWLLLALLSVSLCFALLCGLTVGTAVRQGLLAFGLTLPLMAVLFVVMPRKSEPLWRIPQPKQEQAKTGLSDTMEPGNIGSLVQSNELVANVTFDNDVRPRPEQLYWRAVVMADFDGKTWRALPVEISEPAANARSDGLKVSYQMILRDQNGIIPVLDYPLASNTHPPAVSVRLGNVIRVRSREGLRRVNLQSSVSDFMPQTLQEFEKQYYLRLPLSGNFRTRQLAQLLAGESTSARQFADKVLNYYRRQKFSYTLQPPLYSGNDGIDDFMFGSKQGFCEHYAQSFVVMMRAAGIPARVVTGYLGGDYQENGNFWQIRSKDAHAWAEIWLEEEQAWLRIDPTTAASAQRQSGGLSNALPENEWQLVSGGNNDQIWNRWAESGQFYWQQWVVNYDDSSQNNLFAKIGLGKFNFSTGILVGFGGILVALLPIAWWWLRGRRKEQEPLAEGFLLLKNVLLGSEDETLPSVTASELIEIMKQNNAEDTEVTQLLHQYEEWLFVSDALPSKTEERRWLNKVKNVVQKYAE